eukprot:767429-Hanusia_phi.AAC.9
MKALHDLATSAHSKQASLAVAAASLQKKSTGSVHDILKHPSIVQRFNEVKKKAAAKTRLGIKAQTYSSENVKSASDATEWMPFVLPPLGLCLLGGIGFAVVSIRKWQKIPSMPTQGRMDIKDIQESARQMNSGNKSSKEMKNAWDHL